MAQARLRRGLEEVVVDVMVTSSDKMNDSFKIKDDKYHVRATQETWEKKVAKVVMVPLIISHDGAIHRETVRRWNDFAKDIKIEWVRMAQNVIRYNVVIVRKFFNKESWVSEAWKREHPEEFDVESDGPREDCNARRANGAVEPRAYLRECRVCAVSGHATSTRRSLDVRWKGKPTYMMCGPISLYN